MDSKKIGNFISQLRKEKNMTQDDLAQELYTDRSVVSKWERGLYIPRHDIVLKLSTLFDVSANEIYYGERQNNENKNQVNEVTINIIKDNRKKVKKFVLLGISIIMVLLLSFSTYYFINNYNSISVYTVSGENNNFGIYNGIIVVSREKCYIQLGDTKNFTNVKIKNITLYYQKNNEKTIIFSDSNTSKLLTNTFSHSDLFSYHDLKYILENLYLEITFNDDKSEEIKLTVKRDFINNNIFKKKNTSNYDNEVNVFNSSVPTYIKDNFKLNEKEEKYYLEKNNENIKISQTYYYNAKLYIVEETSSNGFIHFEYAYPNDIAYDKGTDEISTYIISEEKCIVGECDQSIINYFISEYINKIDFDK